MTSAADRCPCGSGDSYAECCGRYHAGPATAPTAEALMRSRFSAFVRGDADYLRRTWLPSTRPSDLELDDTIVWKYLEILAVSAGGPFDVTGAVEFRAHYRGPSGRSAVHERSRFVRLDGRWLYEDGTHITG